MNSCESSAALNPKLELSRPEIQARQTTVALRNQRSVHDALRACRPGDILVERLSVRLGIDER